MMSKEVPQFVSLPNNDVVSLRQTIRNISQTYQLQLGPQRKLYVTGSVALHQALVPNEAWKFQDMDTVVTNIKTPQDLAESSQRTRLACESLGGKFTALHYLLKEQGRPNMRNVMGKTICEMPTARMIPKVTTVFITDDIKTQLANAKPPAVLAFAADDPTTVLLPNHTWWSLLQRRHIPKTTSDSNIKYGPRGFMQGVIEKHKLESTNKENAERIDSLFEEIGEQQWRCAVTAKIHYRTGAAWRNFRLAQGVMVAGASLVVGCGIGTWLLGLPFAVAGLLLGGWIAEQPSRRAIEHQRAGAGYGALEREWSLLYSRLAQDRIRFDWAEAQSLNLQRRKAKLDRNSPNAPEWWKRGVISEIKHKRELYRIHVYRKTNVSGL